MTRAAEGAAEREEGSLDPVRVLVADTDCALFGLLEEWFAASGWQLAGVCGPDEASADGYDLIVVDVPFPRRGAAVLKALATEHPGTPIIALSSNFFPGVESNGAVARELGVAAVLPKPVTRDALMAVAQRTLKGR
jgi:DNA-binding response OmpR family regulator